MKNYLLSQLSFLTKAEIFRISGTDIHPYQENSSLNPLFQSEELRTLLMRKADTQKEPYLYKDMFGVFFLCMRDADEYYLAGPMPTGYLSLANRHAFYYRWSVKADTEKNLRTFSFMDVLTFASTVACIVSGEKYSDHELVLANNLIDENNEKVRHDELMYNIQSEEEQSYRHSYQEERNLLDKVRNGEVEEAVNLSKNLDRFVGKMANDEITHWRDVLVIGATLCARAAIEGGLPPYTAYRISGFYINKGNTSSNPIQILDYRNQAIEELASAVKKQKSRTRITSYTEQCKDYVIQHFREKIYLESIAEKLGLSPSYLSRTFKKDTGKNLQNYIIEVRLNRASEMLAYSDESIPAIAEFVGFPSQSYFGKVFKDNMNMTPKEYRESHRAAEFHEKNKQ